MTLAPHQQRVVDEKADLDVKHAALVAFFDVPMFHTLDQQEQNRMRRQAAAMYLYSSILGERIAAWGAP